MPWTYVQAQSDYAAGTATLTLGAAVGSGNFLNGGGLLPAGVYITSVTDNKGNAYDVVPGGDNNAGSTNGGYVVFGFRSHDLITNGPNVITFHTTATPAGFFFKAVEEWSPPAGTTHISLDGHTNFLNYSTTVPSSMSGTASSPFTTRSSNVFLWGFVWANSTVTTGGGWNTQMTGGASNMFTYNMVAATANSTNALTIATNGSYIYGVIFGTAPVAQSNWVPVQQGLATYNFGPLTTMTVTLPAAATVGNVILGGFGGFSGGTVTIQDNLGGTNYSIIVNDSAHGHCIWGSNGVLTTAPTSFTITSSVSAAIAGTCVEFKLPPSSSATAVDVSGYSDYFTTPNITTLSTSLTTTKAGDLVYTWISSGAAIGDVPLNGFNMLSNWGQKNSDAYFIQSAAGSISPGWNFIGSQGVMVLAVALSLAGISGTMATTEAPDVFSGTGTVFTNITGTMATTETPDAFAGVGTVSAGVSGTMAASEAPDTFAADAFIVTGIDSCSNCIFVRPRTYAANTVLECRINAPIIEHIQGRMGQWPQVLNVDWCGQFQAVGQTLVNTYLSGTVTATSTTGLLLLSNSGDTEFTAIVMSGYQITNVGSTTARAMFMDASTGGHLLTVVAVAAGASVQGSFAPGVISETGSIYVGLDVSGTVYVSAQGRKISPTDTV